MKKFIQLILIFVLVISIAIFYNKFFYEVDEVVEIVDEKIVSQNQKVNQTENNIIKNLNYEIRIEQNNEYKISSELSEITYRNGVELVLMNNVTAILRDEQNRTMFIKSDKATYNNNNYNTNFENNVQIRYLNNEIFAENMILNFVDNYISVLDKIKYNGPTGTLEADNIKINLITKKIDIFMNNSNRKILIKSVR
ncbi:LPS export ABC transporter periplasmic protein LptC [Pelagibacterales bacterium SAG-MED09]|nr:LPS export ABC transporter periplasmic protein LptC [Pelagibacterales bacterium SAG-MED09]